MKIAWEDLKYDERGLIPVVVQDAATREVLTVAYMNAESLRRTLATGETWFWSRSRTTLWHKGETSGHTQRVVHLAVDCDRDALTVSVEPSGPACHTGERTCFHHELEDAPQVERGEERGEERERPAPSSGLGVTLEELFALIESRRRERPENSYTTYLFDRGLDKILKKVGEEAAETIIAAKNRDAPAFIGEVSDLIYHLLVLLAERGAKLAELDAELKGRKEKRSAQ
ncbi:MAG: bifunctional phosphoribosyl-AMP cyclohydrolase/phosphoribosyl-ATP diphosphatase HisIE [Pyrinomonadaceae bacterium]